MFNRVHDSQTVKYRNKSLAHYLNGPPVSLHEYEIRNCPPQSQRLCGGQFRRIVLLIFVLSRKTYFFSFLSFLRSTAK